MLHIGAIPGTFFYVANYDLIHYALGRLYRRI